MSILEQLCKQVLNLIIFILDPPWNGVRASGYTDLVSFPLSDNTGLSKTIYKNTLNYNNNMGLSKNKVHCMQTKQNLTQTKLVYIKRCLQN